MNSDRHYFGLSEDETERLLPAFLGLDGHYEVVPGFYEIKAEERAALVLSGGERANTLREVATESEAHAPRRPLPRLGEGKQGFPLAQPLELALARQRAGNDGQGRSHHLIMPTASSPREDLDGVDLVWRDLARSILSSTPLRRSL